MRRTTARALIASFVILGAVAFFAAACNGQDSATVPLEEIEVESTGTRHHWTDCMYQAAYFAEPSLFVGGSFFVVIRDQSDWQQVWTMQ